MKSIARAYPNQRYLFFNSIKNAVVEARITENGKIYFYSMEDIGEKRINEKDVLQMFPTDTRVNKRPFNYKENKNIWAILNRKKKKYRKKFQTLINQNEKTS